MYLNDILKILCLVKLHKIIKLQHLRQIIQILNYLHCIFEKAYDCKLCESVNL